MGVGAIGGLLQKIANMGVHPGLPERLARKVILSNLICLTLAFITYPYVGIFYFIGAHTLALWVFPIASVYGALAICNYFRLYNVSRYGIISIFSCAILIYAMSFGQSSGIHLLFFPVACMAFILFEREERLGLVYGISVPIGLALYLEIHGFANPLISQIHLQPGVQKFIAVALLITTFAILLSAVYYLYISNEKSERRLVQLLAELSKSEARSRAILSAVPDVIFRVNALGDCLDCQSNDQRLGNMLGSSLAVGKNIATILPSEVAHLASIELGDVIERAQMRSLAFEVSSSGDKASFEARIVKSGAQEALFICQDVTVRTEALRTIAAQQVQMISASKLSALGEMSAGIAHEINNPLAIIEGSAHRMKRILAKPQSDISTLFGLAENIQSTTIRIAKIVNGLRSFARCDGQEELMPCSLKTIVQDTLSLCQERYRASGIDLRLPELDGSVFLNCRPTQVSQVLINLLNNAHDAVEGQSKPWVLLEVSAGASHLEISLTDSGEKIPPPIAEKIFQPFFTTKEIGKGTGLGLSISKGIMESHGGELELNSQASHTCFVMRFKNVA